MIHELSTKQAFEVLFREHYPLLVRYALRMTRDQPLAEDLVQQMFVSLWEKRNETEISGSLKSYLLRSIHNHCLNHFKHLKVREAHAQETLHHASEADGADLLEVEELRQRVDGLIEQLPEQCRKVFLMSRSDGKKYKEIAEEMNISIKTVENQMGKALRVMREGLAEHVSPGMRVLSIIFWMVVGVKLFSVVIAKE